MNFRSRWTSIFLPFIVLLCGANFSFSQNNEIDSLRVLVDEASVDSVKVNNLNELSIAVLRNGGIAESLVLSEQSKQLAAEIGFLKGEAYAEKNIGMAYFYQGEYLEVLDHWTKSLEIFEELGDKQGIANLASNLGAVYYSQGSNTKAIDYYLRALGIAEEINDTLRIATTLLNIGGLYGDTAKDYDKAREYFNQLPPYLESLNNPQITTAYLLGIGEIDLLQERLEEAEKRYMDALPLTINTPEHSNNLKQLGIVESKIGDQDKSIDYLGQAYDIAKENNQQLQMVQALIEIGKVYHQLDNYSKALNAFRQAEELANEMGIKFELKDIYEGLATTYADQGNFTNAYKYQTLLTANKDSLFNLETDDKIRGLQFDFDLQKKQDEVDILAQEAELADLRATRQKWVIYATILGLIILLILGLGAFSRLRYVRKTNRIIENEKNRSQKLLLNILPEETAAELMEHGKVAAQKFQQVTVMFTDFKGFTSTAEGLSPEILVKSVDFYFSRFDAIIEKHGLEKIKTIGDSYMCAGGLHSAPGDHTENMVNAAMEIIEVMKDPLITGDSDIKKFDIRVGINVGPVVAGVVGTNKFAYDIWGDAVNVASRMESLSETGKINISESTYQRIKEKYDCTYRGEVKVKNRGKMKMYFVDGHRKRKYQKAVDIPAEVKADSKAAK